MMLSTMKEKWRQTISRGFIYRSDYLRSNSFLDLVVLACLVGYFMAILFGKLSSLLFGYFDLIYLVPCLFILEGIVFLK